MYNFSFEYNYFKAAEALCFLSRSSIAKAFLSILSEFADTEGILLQQVLLNKN